MNRPVNIQHYIKLITEQPLDREMMRAWFDSVRQHGPNGVISTVQTTDDKGSLRSATMVHREIGEEDGNEYVIPLCRDLTETEASRAVDAFSSLCKQDFDIEISATTATVDVGSVEVAEDKFSNLCSEWAKRQHETWMKERTDAGWTYGSKVSLKNKTHPLLRQWHELPDRFRKIDTTQPQSLLDLLNDQGYAVISREELEAVLKLLKGAF